MSGAQPVAGSCARVVSSIERGLPPIADSHPPLLTQLMDWVPWGLRNSGPRPEEGQAEEDHLLSHPVGFQPRLAATAGPTAPVDGGSVADGARDVVAQRGPAMLLQWCRLAHGAIAPRGWAGVPFLRYEAMQKQPVRAAA